MAATTTLYKSVTLATGESFVLPPGAELVGAENSSALTSECAILSIEDLACYAFVFGNGEDDGDDSQLFEAGGASNTPIRGIKLGDTSYDFVAEITAGSGTGLYDLAATISAINSTSAGNLIFSGTSDVHNEGDNGVMSYIVFKALPSIASKLQLRMYTTAPNFDTNTIEFLIPVRAYADVADYTNIPACTISEI